MNVDAPIRGKKSKMIFHEIEVDKPSSAITIEFTPEPGTSDNVGILIGFEKIPTYKKFIFANQLKDLTSTDGGSYIWFLDSKTINDRKGRWFVSIINLNSTDNDLNELEQSNLIDFTSNYTIRVTTSACYYYDKNLKEWSGKGMELIATSKLASVCRTTHLTHFSSGFFVAPNTIDFSYVFANASFEDNMTIYMTVIVCLVAYFILLIYARIKDLKDVERIKSRSLPDNNLDDNYMYEIITFTGDRKGASCDSKVYFILSGENGATDIRSLDDKNSITLRRGTVDSFVMFTPKCLGNLKHIRIWHDNSGIGEFASWYANIIIIRDIQTNEKFEFPVNKWFASEKSDRLIDRMVHVDGDEDSKKFKTLFTHASEKNIKDKHLWLSVFARPPRSRFTRTQRLSTAIALLFMSMLTNAMWYDLVPEAPSTGGLEIGPFHLTPADIGVGILSSMVTFPPSFLIIFFFTRARKRILRESRIDRALNKGKSDKDDISFTSFKSKKKSKKFSLPWYFKIIAWILCLITIAASIFFLWAYGIQFGNDKTYKWLGALLISFFTGMILLEPLKIMLISFGLSLLCKNFDLNDDSIDDDEEMPQIAPPNEWESDRKLKYIDLNNFNPVDEKYLEQLRKKRIEELEMIAIIKDLLSYFTFIMLMFVLSYGNRDPSGFGLQAQMKHNFIIKKWI